MSKNVLPNGPNVFGKPTPNSSASRVDMVIDKTKKLAFPDAPVLVLENFEHKGDKPEGFQNSVADMQALSGKDLQESYRAGLPQSAEYYEKVSDR